MGRSRKTSAKHLTAGVDSSVYADFAVGDRVRVKEGLLGVVTAVEDGPFPGTEQYQVTLDDGMGGGTWGVGEIVAAGATTAAATEAMVVEAMPFEATGLTTASTDYPELAEILIERPPLPHSEPMRMFASKTASYDEDDEGYRESFTTHYFAPDGNGWCEVCGSPKGWHPDGTDPMVPLPNGQMVPRAQVYNPDGTERIRHGNKTAAPVDWEDAEKHFWCDGCGFQGDLPLSASGIDTCPSCGRQSAHLQPDDLALAASKHTPDSDADQHVLIATSSLWDRVLDVGADILNSQMDEEFKVKPGTSLTGPQGEWCRFRKQERCYFPKTMNEAATAQAGYAVWNPEDRGRCPRNSWAQQQDCPVSEPGPASGDPQARMDATVRWEDGGQRIPAGWTLTNDRYDPHRRASLSKQSAFEFTASWSDIRNKAKRIRSEGGVRIISAPRDENDLTITAEVKGDSEVYETTLLREPGKKNVASWSCGCAWAAYSWGRSGRWKKYEGRMCSHALAVQYEAQAQGFGGGQVKVQPATPPWRVNKNPFEYAKAASLRPVCLDGDLAEAPLARIERESALSTTAKAMLFRNLKALVRGGIRVIEFVMGGQALVKGVGPVPLEEVTYPTWHPSLGLSLSHHASREAHVVDGEDGPHIPGTDEHYPYDTQWADPSRWGRNHFGVWGDDLFVFEPNNAHEMEQGDPAGAASWTPEIGVEAKTAERIDIGHGRDLAWGHLPSGMNAGEMEFTDRGFLTPDPEGFTDALDAYTAPVETQGALPFTTGEDDPLAFESSLAKVAYAGFDIADTATVDEAADALMVAAAEHANQVTRLLMELAARHGGRMDLGPDGQLGYRLKKRPRTVEKITEDVRQKHLRPDQVAESFSDSLRFTILLATDEYTDGAREIMDEMARRGYRPKDPGRVKNYWLRHDPYDGINAVFLCPDGFPFELQFHTDQSLAVKMRNHVEYDDYRSSTDPAERKRLWDIMVGRTTLLPRPPGESGVGVHKFQGALDREDTYYAFKAATGPGYTGVFRKVSTPGDVRFERYSNSQRTWVLDSSVARHLVKGSTEVDEVSEGEALVIVAITRDLEGQALLDRLVTTSALTEVAHTEALVVEALDSPEMAEVVGQSLTEAPPGPGDPRLSWLMGGAPAVNPGAGESSPQNATDGDIAAAATAALAKMALKSFTPEEQAEIIGEGIDVQAANLADLDIKGTHYEGLEAALRQAEDEDDLL